MDYQQLFDSLGGLTPIIGKSFGFLSEVELDDLERCIQGKLPVPYRSYLLQYGAAAFQERIRFHPMKRLPQTVSSSGTDFIDAFYGKEPKGRNAYSLMTRIQFYRGRMPDTIIPIGDNGLGNQICIGVSGKESGKIFYWDRHNEFDEEDYLEDMGIDIDDYPDDHDFQIPPEVRYQNVHLIAESFEDYLQRLEIDPDE